jgi:hypothetical protein
VAEEKILLAEQRRKAELEFGDAEFTPNTDEHEGVTLARVKA